MSEAKCMPNIHFLSRSSEQFTWSFSQQVIRWMTGPRSPCEVHHGRPSIKTWRYFWANITVTSSMVVVFMLMPCIVIRWKTGFNYFSKCCLILVSGLYVEGWQSKNLAAASIARFLTHETEGYCSLREEGSGGALKLFRQAKFLSRLTLFFFKANHFGFFTGQLAVVWLQL